MNFFLKIEQICYNQDICIEKINVSRKEYDISLIFMRCYYIYEKCFTDQMKTIFSKLRKVTILVGQVGHPTHFFLSVLWKSLLLKM